MSTKRFTPSDEPVAWATFVGLGIAAAASYGFGMTSELKELVVYVAPVILAGLWARAQVWSKRSHDEDVELTREYADAVGYGEGYGDALREMREAE